MRDYVYLKCFRFRFNITSENFGRINKLEALMDRWWLLSIFLWAIGVIIPTSWILSLPEYGKWIHILIVIFSSLGMIAMVVYLIFHLSGARFMHKTYSPEEIDELIEFFDLEFDKHNSGLLEKDIGVMSNVS